MESIQLYLNKLRDIHGDTASKNPNRYIKTRIKLTKLELDINFIKICLNHETLPSFSRLKLATTNNKKFIINLRSQITEQELNNKIKNKRKLTKQLQLQLNTLFELTPEQFTELDSIIRTKSDKIKSIKSSKHNKNLEQLGVKKHLSISSDFINKQRNKIDITESIELKQTIFNYSNRTLNETETSVLKKGLKYGIKNKKIDSYEILARFEQLAQGLNKLETKPNQDSRTTQLDNKNAFFQQLQNMALEFVELTKEARDNLSDDEHHALNELAKDTTIIITKADKGNAVVIQNKSDYLNKIEQLLLTGGKFKQLKQNETIKRETKLQNYLRSITDRVVLNKTTNEYEIVEAKQLK